MAAQRRLCTQTRETDTDSFSRYFHALRILLLCAARSTPVELPHEDEQAIRAAIARALDDLAELLSSPLWDTRTHPQMLYDVLKLLCDSGRELVPAGLVNALELHVLGVLRREREETGDGFWADRYEVCIGRLRSGGL